MKYVKEYNCVKGALAEKLFENGAFTTLELAYACYTGKGLSQNTEKAIAYFKSAVEKGHPTAAHDIVVCYDKLGRHSVGEAYIKDMAEKGNLAAQELYAMAICERAYEDRKTIEPKYLTWLKNCAEADYVQSIMLLAQMYEPTNPWQRPCILPQGYYASIGNAYNYFKRAADLGVEDAIEKVNEIEKGRCPYCGSLYTSVRTQKSVFRRSDSLERFCKDCKESFDY